MRSFHFGLGAFATMAILIALGWGNFSSLTRAQSDDGSGDAAQKAGEAVSQ